MRCGAAGVAPDASSTAPARNAIAAKTPRHQLGRPDREELLPARERRAPLQQLEAPEQHEREGHRHEVVDDPVGEHAGQHDVARKEAAQQQDHRGVEDPESRRHARHQPEHHGQHVGAQQLRKGQPRRVGQERIEHRCGERPVGDRDRDLRGRETRPGRRHLEAAHQERLATPRAHDQVRRESGEQREPDRPREGAQPAGRQLRRLERERAAADRREPEPERHDVEDDDAGDLAGLEPEAREHPVAHRAAAEERQPDVVTEDVGDERGEGDARIAQADAHVAAGERVVAGEREIGERREQERERHVRRGNRAQMADHVTGVELVDLAVQDPDRAGEEPDPEQRPENSDEPLLHRSRLPWPRTPPYDTRRGRD